MLLTEVKHYAQIYGYVYEGELLQEVLPPAYARACAAAAAHTFRHVEVDGTAV